MPCRMVPEDPDGVRGGCGGGRACAEVLETTHWWLGWEAEREGTAAGDYGGWDEAAAAGGTYSGLRDVRSLINRAGWAYLAGDCE